MNVSSIFCPNCGQQNQRTDAFCAHCGHALRTTEGAQHTSRATERASGPQAGQSALPPTQYASLPPSSQPPTQYAAPITEPPPPPPYSTTTNQAPLYPLYPPVESYPSNPAPLPMITTPRMVDRRYPQWPVTTSIVITIISALILVIFANWIDQQQSYSSTCINYTSSQSCATSFRTVDIVHLPVSLVLVVTFIVLFLGLFLVIMAGLIVNRTYGGFIIRLVTHADPEKAPGFFARALAILYYNSFFVVVLTLVGLGIGELVALIPGVHTNFHFLTSSWLLHAGILVLLGILGTFTYTSMTLFFSTWTRSGVFGIFLTYLWFCVELTINIITLFTPHGPLEVLQKWLISNNIFSLLVNQNHYLTSTTTNTTTQFFSDQQALSVLVVYLAIWLIGSLLLHITKKAPR
ncbi:zinc ribbon domain-containing protein [Tengunoibacter tsumagoiensis]|uniref:Zinc-ribbon domain-containing protein n=1 Tax=Tengunoibacter tsumagoiensis TaxID=2014871 RepID=A0A401ZWR5_9CHLR|nr:zinc ribbon domain-containing protein [Tengunoibacter tsumagoiensis]GCE11315.1 hypothetical protein KTT_11740 [Tengunoibacter tsumagoiensis]